MKEDIVYQTFSFYVKCQALLVTEWTECKLAREVVHIDAPDWLV